MSKTWITSDHHFGHGNLLRFTDRDGSYFRGDRFSSVGEMDEYLIERWNAVVSPDDKVYHLGDFSMSHKTAVISRYASALHGRKVLIRGNHDKAKLSAYSDHFKDVRATHLLATGIDRPSHLVLSHVPLHPASIKSGWVNVHGHTHEKGSPHGPYVSVCVEVTDWAPVGFASVVESGGEILLRLSLP